MGKLSSTIPGSKVASSQVVLSVEEEEYHKEKAKLAQQILQKLHQQNDQEGNSDTDDETLEPPTAPLTKSHFNRRRSANIALAAAEEYIQSGRVRESEALRRTSIARRQESTRSEVSVRKASRQSSIASYTASLRKESADLVVQQEEEDVDCALHDAVTTSLKQVVKDMSKTDAGRQQETSIVRARRASKNINADAILEPKSPGHYPSFARQVSETNEKGDPVVVTSRQVTPRRRFSSVVHDEVNQILKTGGTEMGRLTPLAHDKPVLKDPIGIQCVSHLKDRKWKELARGIRDTIYDPEFYDDGTYAPMYVRVAIHACLNWDQHTQTGGCEGAAMRFKPEMSDAHNRFCKPIIKRQHDLIKIPFPWASYADIQVLCAYVSIECAGGPVIPFSPGRRDVRPDEKFDFVYQNYEVRGDRGQEGAPVPDPKSKAKAKKGFFHTKEGGDPNACPFLTKTMVMPGRIPGPEAGHLGKAGALVSKEREDLELREVAKEIREGFQHRIGTTDQYTVALIAGGHSFGRCHPEISGYAGPWQSNPGYFNNVYCQKLLHDDWKLVDKNMEDCSGDLITGVKPKGMRRQYVNKGGKGDLMMLVSDMALKRDPSYNMWLKLYANDLGALHADFATAFKWITEVGFEKPPEMTGLSKAIFNTQVTCDAILRWIGSKVCADVDDDDSSGSGDGGAVKEEEKVGNPYTMEEVAKHTKPDDVWVVINKKVVDLSKFKEEHPGGEAVIMQFAGKDASSEWNVIHSRNAIEKLAPQVKIGYLK